jgi:hypothetical protein
MDMRASFIVLFILCVFFTLPAFAQEKLIEINGVIRSSETNEPVAYVHVMNTTSGYGTVSNSEGRFWITMLPQDTLIFSAISYAKMAFSLKPDQTSRKLNVDILMNEETRELQPVKVFAYRDEETLKQALIEMDVEVTENTDRIQLPGFYYGPRREHKPSVGNPISFIASKFSREIKEQKKLEKAQADYDYSRMIKAKYNQQVVINLTGLPEDEVEDFMEFCAIEEAFIAQSNAYEIAVKVQRCLSDYELKK